MMPTAFGIPQFNVNVSRDPVPTQTITPTSVPDEKWRHVDSHGHGHFWDGNSLPTLNWVVTGTKWVGDEYDGETVEVGEHRCAICDEVVEPQRRTKNVRSRIVYGPRVFLVEFEGERYELSEAEYAECVEAWRVATQKIARRPPTLSSGGLDGDLARVDHVAALVEHLDERGAREVGGERENPEAVVGERLGVRHVAALVAGSSEGDLLAVGEGRIPRDLDGPAIETDADRHLQPPVGCLPILPPPRKENT